MVSASQSFREREQILDEIVVAYFEAVESGHPPDEEWFQRFAHWRTELGGFLSDQEKVIRWTEPLRKLATAMSIAMDDPCRTMGEEEGSPVGAPASVIGNYELLDEIARGGMGVVYRARQISLNRIVALKMILAGQLASRAEVQRFRTEAEAVASLDHPNIMPIFEVGEHEGRPFFSMKLIEGGSLAQNLNRYSGDQEATARLVATVARAVHHAHQRGILHRDLKPANILLDGHSQPYVTDFGLARRVQGDSGVTQSGAVVGTPSYMAPEQAAGRKCLTTSADVYSLGAILYAMLTNRPPFRADTPLETVRQVVEEEPSRPRLLNPRVERDLETICMMCLHKEPQHRYGSAEALAEDLERWLGGEPIQARSSALWERVAKRVKRKPAATALVGVTILALLGAVVGGFLYQAERARVAEHELAEHRRVSGLRSEVQDFVHEAESHLARGDWDEAKMILVKAVAKGTSQPATLEETLRAQHLLAEAERKLDELKARRTALGKLDQFAQHRDEVLFHGSLFTGVDLPTNIEKTLQAGRQALSLFGLSLDGEEALELDRCFTDPERKAIVSGCYELLVVLAEAMVQQDPPEVELALRLLNRAQQMGPATKSLQVRRARYLEKLGTHARAETEAEQASRVEASSALDHFLLGDDLRRSGQVQAAIREFEGALRLDPDHFWAHYFLAVCRLPADPKEAKAHLSACIRQQPEFGWCYQLRGFAHGELRELFAAEADFEKAIEGSSKLASGGTELRYAVHVNRGVLRARHGRFEEGMADLRHAITLCPNEYQAYWNLANALRQTKQLDKAVEQIDMALERAREIMGERDQSLIARMLQDRALLHFEKQDWEQVLRDVEQALEVKRSAEAYVIRGRVKFRQGEYEDAAKAYEMALRSAPADVRKYDRAEIHKGRAESLFKLEDYREAAYSFDRYLADGGEPNADVFRLRGLCRAKLEDYSRAIHDYTQSLALKPDDSTTYALRGWVYYVRHALTLAMEDFESAIRLDRDNCDGYSGRGYVFVTMGKVDRAVESVEEALRRGPDSARTALNGARVYGLAMSLLEDERRGPSAITRSKCRDRALKLLGKALESTPPGDRVAFWRTLIEPDIADSTGALYPLRNDAEFGRLAAEYARSLP